LCIGKGVDSGGIDAKTKVSLLAKVNAALAALAKDKPNAAKVAGNNLKALIREVEAQTGKKITPEVVEVLIFKANSTIAALGG